MIIWHKKRSYLEHKQKELLYIFCQKGTQSCFRRALKEMIWRFHLHDKKQDYCTKLCTLGQSISIHIIPNAQLPNVFTKGQVWTIMKKLANYKAADIHGLNLEFLIWVENDLYEAITKHFHLVAREGFLPSWDTNVIQMISKSSERSTLGNYKTTVPGAIVDNLYVFDLVKTISQWTELKGIKAKGQTSFKEFRSTLDTFLHHVL